MTSPLHVLTLSRVVGAIGRVTGAPADTITSETRIEVLGADALDLLEIALELETEFSVEISDGEMHQAGTVGELVALVESKQEAANA